MPLPNLSGLSARAVAPTGDFATISRNHANKLNGTRGANDGHEPLLQKPYKAGDVYFRLLRPGKQLGSENPNDYDWFDPEELYKWVWEQGGSNPLNRSPVSDEDRDALKDRFAPHVPSLPRITRAAAREAGRHVSAEEEEERRLEWVHGGPEQLRHAQRMPGFER